ncbi:MAG: GNAT family N-acetyltransferase [Myxococcaceae bacterium]
MAAAPRSRIEWTTDVGELVAIEPRPEEVSAHAVELAAGYNEPDNARLMGHAAPFSDADVVAHYQSMVDEGARPFLLYRGHELVGDADLRGIRNGAAEFAFMIGARSHQRKGLGTRFALMAHAFAFRKLGLDRVYASIVPQNRASRRVFEKLGYALDDSTEARAFADEASDVTMVVERATFERGHATALAQVRIAPRRC